jgi:thymidylate synthase
MRVINANSVNDALYQGGLHLRSFGVESPSRNGPVIVSPMPVVTVYNQPRNRVLVSEVRDANPFFHLFESLWMLAGRNDVAFPAHFVGTMRQYSDDGETLHGAYGYRWRHWFGCDQLLEIIETLQKDPTTRRAVLAMWDGVVDLITANEGGKDVPCNTHAYFDTIDGRLNMTVLCRSNDAVFGAYGANAVHFSILHEFVAFAAGLPLGVYRQFSNNFHAYTELYTRILGGELTREALGSFAVAVGRDCIYGVDDIGRLKNYARLATQPTPILQYGESAEAFLEDCDIFCTTATSGMELLPKDFSSAFFQHTIAPMLRAWQLHKAKDYGEARLATLTIHSDDWRTAAQSWLSVREQRRAGGNDD